MSSSLDLILESIVEDEIFKRSNLWPYPKEDLDFLVDHVSHKLKGMIEIEVKRIFRIIDTEKNWMEKICK